MTTLMFAAVMQLAAAAPAADGYGEAHRQTTETGRSLVVMVGTDWCGPCQQMKKTVIPQARERGLLAKVAFAHVNADQQAELAQELTGGGPVPQLVMFRKTPNGWMRRKLVGGQSVEAVERFIHDGLVASEAENRAAETQPVSSGPEDRAATKEGKSGRDS